MFGEDTEQPNENQSSFGPSNQSSTFEQSKPQENSGSQSSGWASGGNTGISGGTQPLPWQQNDMGQNNSIAAPNMPNPYVQQNQQQQPQQQQWQTQDVGHEGTTQGGDTRQSFRDAWMSSGINNSQGMDQWLQQHGGQRLNESGVVRTPFGEILDMGIGYKGGNGRPGWTDIGMNQMPQGNFGSFGPSSPQQQQQAPMMQGGMQNQQQQQVDPRMLAQFQQQMQNMQPGSGIARTGMDINRNQNPSLFQNAGQTQDISSFLNPQMQGGISAPTQWSAPAQSMIGAGQMPVSQNMTGAPGMMSDYMPQPGVSRSIDRSGMRF